MGKLQGEKGKLKGSFKKLGYQTLENPPDIVEEEERLKKAAKLEEIRLRKTAILKEIQQLEQDLKKWTARRGEVKQIDIPAESTALLEQCYREDFNETFEEPKTVGFAEIVQDETVPYEYNFKKGAVKEFELVKSVDAKELKAAAKAAFKVGLEAEAEVEFRKKYLIGSAEFKAFLGAAGVVEGKVEVADWDKIVLQGVAQFFAGAKIECKGDLTVGSADNNFKVELKGDASVGIEGMATGSLTLDRGQFSAVLKLSGFAGAKATAKGGFSVNIFGRELFKGEASAYASVGVGADLTAELHVGVEKTGWEFGVGTTLGIGTGTSVSTEIKNIAVVMTLKEAKDRIVNAKPYLEGYRSLNLQDKEWQLKVESLIKAYDDKISAGETQVKKLRREHATM